MPCRIVVKSPDDRVPAHSVVCLPSWSVRNLKEYIAEVFPSHPSPSDQRIIHAGKLLKDDVSIQSIFKNPEEVQTVHLVCRTSNTTNQTKKLSGMPTINDLPPAELERYQREYYDYLQNFFMTNHAPATPLSSDNPMMTSASPASSPQNFWYTQPTWNWPGTAAAQQQQQPPWNYWYHPAAYGFPAPPPGPPAAATTPPEGDSGVVDPAAPGAGWMQGVRAILTEFTGVGGQEQAAEVPAHGVAPEGAPQPQGQQQQQQQAIMMGNPMVGGFMGAEEFGEGAENMDIVDRFYMLFRLCLFIGLCFAYSSLDKAIIVFSVAAYVYFYNIYRRHAAMRRAAAAVAVAEAQRTQEQATQPGVTTPSTESNHAAGTPSTEGSNTASGTNDDPDQQVRSRDTSNSSEHSAPQVTSTEPAGIQRLTSTLRLVVSTSYQFLFSLLTSLIPEQPPPIRLD